MCARIKRRDGQWIRSGQKLLVVGPMGKGEVVHAGFAQVEKMTWWKRQQGFKAEVDVPAEGFQERNGNEFMIKPTEVLKGLGFINQFGERVVKILTRAPRPWEQKVIEHNRIPVYGPAAY